MNAPLMIGEAFPANDVLARWVMVLSIARNDLALATERIVRANEDDDGTNMHWQRLLAAHFFEAGAVALRSGFTQQLPEQPRSGNRSPCAWRARRPDAGQGAARVDAVPADRPDR